MSQSFDDLTQQWLKLQQSFLKPALSFQPNFQASPGSGANGMNNPFAAMNKLWSGATETPALPLNALFTGLMEQSRIMGTLGSCMLKASTESATPWQEMLRGSIERSFRATNSQGPFSDWLNTPFDAIRGALELPEGLNYSLKPLTSAFTAEGAFQPVRYEHLLGLLSVPGFGYTREHQEQHQSLMRLGVEMQRAQAAYAELFADMPRRVFEVLVEQIDARAAQGEAIENLRDIYDLYVDAAEVAYAEIANSDLHTERYGQNINALMAFRKEMQCVADEMQEAMNHPTRKELDGLHKNLITANRDNAQLRREIAALNDRLEAIEKANKSVTAIKKDLTERVAALESTPSPAAKAASPPTSATAVKETAAPKAAATASAAAPAKRRTTKPKSTASRRKSAKES